MTSIRLPLRPATSPLWAAAQGGGLVLTGVLIVGLFVRPTLALHVLWDMMVPLLPAVFLLNPIVWRNVCPLATLNAFTGQRLGGQRVGVARLQVAWTAGVVLLVLLVPARRFLFNVNGPVLALTIIAVAVIAAGAGVAFARRAGFCNALCPVLPVEKLYGQAPLLRVGNARCGDCSLCTPVGCIDLAGNKSVAQTVGRSRRHASWVWTPFGVFAASFPGFVVGYFTIADAGLGTAPEVYAHVAMYAAASLLIVVVAAHVFSTGARTLLRFLGGAAFLLYYWYSAPTLAESYGAAHAGTVVIRTAAAVLLALWWWRGRQPRSLAIPNARG